MFNFFNGSNKSKLFSRSLLFYILLAFGFTTFLSYNISQKQLCYAQLTSLAIPNNLPIGELRVTNKSFDLATIRGIKFNPNNSNEIKFYFDTMDSKSLSDKEADKLIKYFLGFLSLPEDKLWVNLSPYEKDRIIPDSLAKLDIGKDMLIEDFLLKQLTASLTSPKTKQGKKFWENVYKQVYKLAKTKNIPVNSFYKVWITPKESVIIENKNTAFIKQASLKVMLEEDYFGLANYPSSKSVKAEDKLTQEIKNLFRKEIIPLIEQQINQSVNFAPLRQLYYACILAKYYKNKFTKTPSYASYINRENINNIDIANSQKIKEKIYNSYQASFRQGSYNQLGNKINNSPYRRYFSGGIVATANPTIEQIGDTAETPTKGSIKEKNIEINSDFLFASFIPQEDKISSQESVKILAQKEKITLTSETKKILTNSLRELQSIALNNSKMANSKAWDEATNKGLLKSTDRNLLNGIFSELKNLSDETNLEAWLNSNLEFFSAYVFGQDDALLQFTQDRKPYLAIDLISFIANHSPDKKILGLIPYKANYNLVAEFMLMAMMQTKLENISNQTRDKLTRVQGLNSLCRLAFPGNYPAGRSLLREIIKNFIYRQSYINKITLKSESKEKNTIALPVYRLRYQNLVLLLPGNTEQREMPMHLQINNENIIIKFYTGVKVKEIILPISELNYGVTIGKHGAIKAPLHWIGTSQNHLFLKIEKNRLILEQKGRHPTSLFFAKRSDYQELNQSLISNLDTDLNSLKSMLNSLDDLYRDLYITNIRTDLSPLALALLRFVRSENLYQPQETRDIVANKNSIKQSLEKAIYKLEYLARDKFLKERQLLTQETSFDLTNFSDKDLLLFFPGRVINNHLEEAKLKISFENDKFKFSFYDPNFGIRTIEKNSLELIKQPLFIGRGTVDSANKIILPDYKDSNGYPVISQYQVMLFVRDNKLRIQVTGKRSTYYRVCDQESILSIPYEYPSLRAVQEDLVKLVKTNKALAGDLYKIYFRLKLLAAPENYLTKPLTSQDQPIFLGSKKLKEHILPYHIPLTLLNNQDIVLKVGNSSKEAMRISYKYDQTNPSKSLIKTFLPESEETPMVNQVKDLLLEKTFPLIIKYGDSAYQVILAVHNNNLVIHSFAKEKTYLTFDVKNWQSQDLEKTVGKLIIPQLDQTQTLQAQFLSEKEAQEFLKDAQEKEDEIEELSKTDIESDDITSISDSKAFEVSGEISSSQNIITPEKTPEPTITLTPKQAEDLKTKFEVPSIIAQPKPVKRDSSEIDVSLEKVLQEDSQEVIPSAATVLGARGPMAQEPTAQDSQIAKGQEQEVNEDFPQSLLLSTLWLSSLQEKLLTELKKDGDDYKVSSYMNSYHIYLKGRRIISLTSLMPGTVIAELNHSISKNLIENVCRALNLKCTLLEKRADDKRTSYSVEITEKEVTVKKEPSLSSQMPIPVRPKEKTQEVPQKPEGKKVKTITIKKSSHDQLKKTQQEQEEEKSNDLYDSAIKMAKKEREEQEKHQPIRRADVEKIEIPSLMKALANNLLKDFKIKRYGEIKEEGNSLKIINRNTVLVAIYCFKNLSGDVATIYCANGVHRERIIEPNLKKLRVSFRDNTQVELGSYGYALELSWQKEKKTVEKKSDNSGQTIEIKDSFFPLENNFETGEELLTSQNDDNKKNINTVIKTIMTKLNPKKFKISQNPNGFLKIQRITENKEKKSLDKVVVIEGVINKKGEAVIQYKSGKENTESYTYINATLQDLNDASYKITIKKVATNLYEATLTPIEKKRKGGIDFGDQAIANQDAVSGGLAKNNHQEFMISFSRLQKVTNLQEIWQ